MRFKCISSIYAIYSLPVVPFGCMKTSTARSRDYGPSPPSFLVLCKSSQTIYIRYLIQLLSIALNLNMSETGVAGQNTPVMVCKYEENLLLQDFITIMRAGKFK